jgi:hypothetical protein
VAGIAARGWVYETIGDVEGVARRGRGFHFERLEATVVRFGKIDSVEGAGLADGSAVFGTLRRVADAGGRQPDGGEDWAAA